MFTGLVQAVGSVRSLVDGRLTVEAPDAWPGDPWVEGESVSVDGCCLTLLRAETPLAFDLSPETLRRTNLGSRVAGSRVNLERAMRPADRLGGHIVQGHVDGPAELIAVEEHGADRMLRVRTDGGRYLIDKGSVALDGVSLTVVRPSGGEFEVWVVPHTWAVTTLADRKPGDRMNIEFDVLAKHVERLLAERN